MCVFVFERCATFDSVDLGVDSCVMAFITNVMYVCNRVPAANAPGCTTA